MSWRIYATQQACQQWCDQQYAAMVRERAATLDPQELVDHWDLPNRARIPDLPDSALVGSRFPLYGRNAASGAWNTTSGYTSAWAIPRETAAGDWAAECRDPQDPAGQPEPTWPDPGPI